MIRSLLIANRGEIACRIAATARRLGIRTIAVYSEADRTALHVTLADEAIAIGPAPARESYLSIPRLIEAARTGGAEAIHPGYGFLSENPDFAEACKSAGLIFIGPPPAAIRAMGSKAEAKQIMAEAGVPLVPGYHGTDQSLPRLIAEAIEIGFPMLIKASAGGGGKGMRVVEKAADFAEALAAAQREAASAFGNPRVLIERYLPRPRHIEVQILADHHGAIATLFERDCSIQRRHQKIIEEAPAPNLSEAFRAAIATAATAAARAVGYCNAGTVEFIAEGEQFYFMEMNTRLQVEHPVTEFVSGLDLVEWQIRIAQGEHLPALPSTPAGHAIEARLYAEDPARDFIPSAGPITLLRLPPPQPWLRLDCGIREGEVIGTSYDPMLAKLIVHGETRADAVRKLRQALSEAAILGPRTNLPLLAAIANHESFANADLDTGFIPRHAAALAPVPPPRIEIAIAAALIAAIQQPRTPAPGFRLNLPAAPLALHLRVNDATLALALHISGSLFSLSGDITAEAEALIEGNSLILTLCNRRRIIPFHRSGAGIALWLDGNAYEATLLNPLAPPAAQGADSGSLTAPMPGTLTRCFVTKGESVSRGAPLAVIEAMKMELTIAAPSDGIVETVFFAEGDLVPEGAALFALASA